MASSTTVNPETRRLMQVKIEDAVKADEIFTTAPAAEYAFLSGTSLAAAHISGIVALVLEKAPEFGAGQIASLLRDTSVAAAGEESVNACRALAKLTHTSTCRPGEALLSRAD